MTSTDWAPGVLALSARDDKMAAIIESVGEPDLRSEPDAWTALSGAIMGQQISVHAARAIRGRFAALDAERGYPLPAQVLAEDDETLRACGLSRGKILSVRDLAAHCEDGRVDGARFEAMDDEAVIQSLIPVRGIGRWTAEMFLMFSLGRPDVWAVDDLGLRVAVARLHDLPERPDAKTMRELAEPWKPWRSLASWYLWRWLDTLPKVAGEPKAAAPKAAPSTPKSSPSRRRRPA